MEDTPKSLLQRLRRNPNDEASWTRLVELYTPFLKKHLASLCSPNDIDDITQAILARVVRLLPKFEHNAKAGAFRKWLRQIAYYCLKEHRSARGEPAEMAMVQLEALADDASELSRLIDQEHHKHVVHKLLEFAAEQFSARDMVLFKEAFLMERPLQDIANAHGVKANIVSLAKGRILAWLRREGQGLIDDN